MYAIGTYKNNNPEEFRNHININSIVDEVSGCWNFTGAKTETGYGHVRFFGVYAKIHRVSYWAFKDNSFKVMDNFYQVIMHSCDNPSCVNPEHLSVGTHRDNQEDMTIKKNGKILMSIEDRDYFIRNRVISSNKKKAMAESSYILSKINLPIEL